MAGPYNQTSLKRYFYGSDKLDNSDMMSEVDDDKTENDDRNIEIDQSVEESNDSNSINSAKDIDDNNSKESESENEILCTPQPKRLRKSNKRKSYEYY